MTEIQDEQLKDVIHDMLGLANLVYRFADVSF